MQYICISIHIMRMHLPIGHRRNARPHEADRQSNHPESAAGTMWQQGHARSSLSFRAFEERLARTTASAPKTRKKHLRLRIPSNKQKPIREVSVRFMVIDGEAPKKIDIRQNACYSLSE